MVLSALLLLLAQQGEVRLPLADYLALAERAEATRQAPDDDLVIAELTSQTASLVWGDDGVEISSRYEVHLEGRPTRPVDLPVTGLVSDVTITPSGAPAVQAAPEGLRFVAPEPGRYRIAVRSRVGARVLGDGRLELAPFLAPVGQYEADLPAELFFRAAGAVVSEDAVRDGRRLVRFAVPRGEGHVIEARRELASADAETLLAKVDVVTLIDLRARSVVRHDVVLYDVSRGWMGAHEVTIPPRLDVERVATDEGRTPVLVDGGRLRVERRTKLAGRGYLVVTSRPDGVPEVSLVPVAPTLEIRARFLAAVSTVAADVEPLPGEDWLRLDSTDLPPRFRAAVEGVDPVWAWRHAGDASSASLRVDRKPEASMLGAVVHERESTSLLTAEGTLVTRDRFTVESRTPFRIRLAPADILWSASVDDVLVRPVERDGELLVPIGVGTSDVAVVEIVAIREKALPSEKSRIELDLPEVAAPVLAHRWRVMLPEGNRYRFVDGDLAPVVERTPAEPASGRFSTVGSARALGMGGSASVWGRVFDQSGSALPGATVTLRNDRTGWNASVNADRNGSFWFLALPSGLYTLVAELAGFAPAYYQGFHVASGRNAAYRLTLRIAGVEESVAILGEGPPALTELESREEDLSRRESKAEASRLRAGLVGGVKPLPVVIPETGKVLTLTGALPPPRIRVELDVKPR